MLNLILVDPTLIFLITSACAFATCVVVIRTDKKITIGADSRRQIFSSDGQFKGNTNLGCKIRQCGHFFYTLVGVDDRLQIHHASLLSGENLLLDNLVEVYANRMVYDYNISLEVYRDNDPESFKKAFSKGKVFTEMAFAGIENNIPQVRIIEFYNASTIDVPTNVILNIKSNPLIKILGTSSYFKKLKSPEQFSIIQRSKTSPLEIINAIVENQEQESPDYVALPVDILQIDADGPVWIARKAECEEQT